MKAKLAASLPGYLRDGWLDCQRCPLCQTRTGSALVGRGNPQARFMLVGEAPGPTEESQKKSFTGAGAELLGNILNMMELDLEKDVWMTYVVNCRPPDLQYADRTRAPGVKEIRECKPRLLEEVYRIDPLMIVALGSVAAKALGGPSCSMQKYRGQVTDIQIPGRGKGSIDYAMRVTWNPDDVLKKMNMKTRNLPTDLPRMSTSDDILSQLVWDLTMAYAAFRLAQSFLEETEVPEVSRYITSIL